ncbi:unnamed protein product, partial [marine sediment metagenome]
DFNNPIPFTPFPLQGEGEDNLLKRGFTPLRHPVRLTSSEEEGD